MLLFGKYYLVKCFPELECANPFVVNVAVHFEFIGKYLIIINNRVTTKKESWKITFLS
jgi:hypothetical protein